jgi:transcriptional regulator of arginine metabolism
MSKLARHAAIRDAITSDPVYNQDELRRLLFKRGHRVTQATLSRDIHELGLIKTAEGSANAWLPSVERLIHEFVYEVKTAQNIVVVKTSAGSAQPVAAALDAEGWPEVVGTVGGDDTVFIVSPNNKSAEKLLERIKELLA